MRAILLRSLPFALTLLFATVSQAQVKIGVAGPITGANAAFGAQLTQGVEQAVEDINKAGAFSAKNLRSSLATTCRIPSRAFRSPTSSSATASSSWSAISTRA